MMMMMMMKMIPVFGGKSMLSTCLELELFESNVGISSTSYTPRRH
jgi:hypothetical protein